MGRLEPAALAPRTAPPARPTHIRRMWAQDIRAIFRSYDTDGSGELDCGEFKQVATKGRDAWGGCIMLGALGKDVLDCSGC